LVACYLKQNTSKLQEDLSNLHEWSNRWQMKFNAKKCYTLRVHRKQNPIIHNYTMGSEELSSVSSQAYLGVELHEQLHWKHHIEAVVSKASRTLGFLRRNLGNCKQTYKLTYHWFVHNSSTHLSSGTHTSNTK